MADRGLEPDFSRDVLSELGSIRDAAPAGGHGIRDLRDRLWVSIDNDDSRDLDQLTVSENLPGGRIRILVAIADVDALVPKGSAIDVHARTNTTSIYTAAEIFPMLPEKLSTDLTSLNEGADRLAVVAEMDFERDGTLVRSELYRAAVHNRSKLAYDSVSVGLEGGAMPEKAEATSGVPEQLRVQDSVAQALRSRRHEEGALDLETIEPRAVFDGDTVTDLAVQPKNRARELIEDFMIAANGVTARFLAGKGIASLRRVVRSPERWAKIVEVAGRSGDRLPVGARRQGARGLSGQAATRRSRHVSGPLPRDRQAHGRGRIRRRAPRPAGDRPLRPGGPRLHPLDRTEPPISGPRHPAPGEGRARGRAAGLRRRRARIPRRALHRAGGRRRQGRTPGAQVRRRAPARAAPRPDASTPSSPGASEKGTWVRIFQPPVEGKLVHGWEDLEVGDRLRVKLISTDVERGFIDFVRIG